MLVVGGGRAQEVKESLFQSKVLLGLAYPLLFVLEVSFVQIVVFLPEFYFLGKQSSWSQLASTIFMFLLGVLAP